MVLALGVCAAALMGAVGLPSAARAQTQQVPQVVQDNLDSATQFYAKESGVAEAACDAGCEALVRDLDRPPTVPKDPMPARIIKSLVDKAVRVGGQVATKVPWKMPSPWYVGGVTALVAANYVVWKVKVIDPIRRAYYVEAPKSLIDSGPVGLSLQFADGTDGGAYVHDPVTGTLPDPLPIGIVARNNTLARAQTGGCASICSGQYCGNANFAGIPKPAEMVEYTWIESNGCNGVNYLFHGWRVPIEESLGFINGLDSYDAPDSPVTFDVDGTLMTLQELKDRLQGVLTSDDPEYGDIGQWMCAVFGGECQNPKDAYPTTPDCTGMTAAACTRAFRDAGFVGDITTQTLNADQAVMEQQAGKVTATYPHADIQIAAPRDIRIYENPDPMPVMTAAQLSLADDLQTQNPTSVNASNKLTLAKTCSEDMNNAGRPTSDCLALPIMVIGNDQETPARNALQGLLRNPSWIVLNARISKNLNRNSWYRNLGQPAPGCLTAERKPITDSCDEYPFWSTLQAHNGTLSLPGLESSIRWAPKGEHDRQAQVINQFYSQKSPGQVMKFHGCGIAKQLPTDPAPSLASAFAVIPLPFSSAIQSTGVCNKVVPTDNTPDPTEDPNP